MDSINITMKWLGLFIVVVGVFGLQIAGLMKYGFGWHDDLFKTTLSLTAWAMIGIASLMFMHGMDVRGKIHDEAHKKIMESNPEGE